MGYSEMDIIDLEYKAPELLKIAKKRHPHSIGICRHGGGAKQKYRICNLCEGELGSYSGNYPRTQRSYKFEYEHILMHIKEYEEQQKKETEK